MLSSERIKKNPRNDRISLFILMNIIYSANWYWFCWIDGLMTLTFYWQQQLTICTIRMITWKVCNDSNRHKADDCHILKQRDRTLFLQSEKINEKLQNIFDSVICDTAARSSERNDQTKSNWIFNSAKLALRFRTQLNFGCSVNDAAAWEKAYNISSNSM